MGLHHAPGRGGTPFLVLSPQDVVPNGPPGSLLHGYPLGRGPLPKRCALILREAKSHGHQRDDTILIPEDLPA